MGASSPKPQIQALDQSAATGVDDESALYEYIAAMSLQLSQMARRAGDVGLALTLEAASVQAGRNIAN